MEINADTDAIEIAEPDDLTVVRSAVRSSQSEYLLYIVLPAIFLTVALLGGMRLASADNAFIFLKPPVVCLVFWVMLMILFFRGGLIDANGWFAEDLPTLKNIANAAVLLALFAASAQLFNSLLPESGLPFWIVVFCFFWTLWNNLFLDFDPRRLLRSLGAMFGLAFVAKYLILQYLTAPSNQNWLQAIIENPARGAMTWLLDLPRYSPGTGYIQFFTAVLYMLGLFLLPRSTRR